MPPCTVQLYLPVLFFFSLAFDPLVAVDSLLCGLCNSSEVSSLVTLLAAHVDFSAVTWQEKLESRMLGRNVRAAESILRESAAVQKISADPTPPQL